MPVRQTTERWLVLDDGSKVRSAELETADYGEWPTPRTHADADAQAEARGLVFPDEVKTVAEKVNFLASA